MTVHLSSDDLERYRRGLRLKVWCNLGSFCPDAEDLVQDTLTRFLSAVEAGTIRNTEAIGAFLHGICTNVIREYRARARREQAYVSEPPSEPHRASEVVQWLEARDALDALLPLLAERDRQVLEAIYLKEQTAEDVCRELNITDANLRVILFRAKERLRKIYTGTMKFRAPLNH